MILNHLVGDLMNKIIIALVLLAGLSETVLSKEPWTARKYIEQYQKAKETTDEGFLTTIETYISGITKGVVMTDLYSGSIGKGNLFCPPKGKSFKTNEIVSLISELDEEFKKGNTIYPNDPLAAPLEITMIWALRHFYPCGDE
tara:strand:+ start:214 stop:642 length:429 start_codon:yes stop_codon:yes gene_type:complete